MPSNVSRSFSAMEIRRARSKSSSYWNVTFTPITVVPPVCPGASRECRRAARTVGFKRDPTAHEDPGLRRAWTPRYTDLERPASRRSGLQESQQVGVDRLGLGGRHAVR